MANCILDSKTEFIGNIYQDALKVSEQSGISLDFILGQTALETGWGKKVLPGTNNLFNIKADSSWEGDSKTFSVKEYVNGKWITTQSSFRVYDSYQQSINDWLDFLQENPRYSDVFDPNIRGDLEKIAQAIKDAGYATDPNYVSLVINTANGRTMKLAKAKAIAEQRNLKMPDSFCIDKTPKSCTLGCHPDPRQRIKPILTPPTNPNDPRRSDRKSNTYRIVWIGDPLVLDLDGDGIETVAASSGVLFDHNADGIQTTSGWVKPDDGLLVRDINGNGLINTGRELFGDSTLLKDGTTAVNGFVALAELDSNADGVIDAADAAFGELKVWQDLNQDGISQEGELKSLAELGITSFNLTRTSSNTTLAGGVQSMTGSYTRADGSTAVLADLNLTQDTFNSQYTTSIAVPEELQNLPDLPGMGRLRSLQEAAALSPVLAELLQQYAAATTRDAQKGLIDQLLLAWAKTDPLYSDEPIKILVGYGDLTQDNTSTNIIYLRNGQSLSFPVIKPTYADTLAQSRTRIIDAIMGDRLTTSLNNIISHETDYINTVYEALSDAIYQSLLTQTRLKPYLDSVELLITEDSISLDFSAMEAQLQDKLVANPQNGMTDLIELNRYTGDLLASSGWDGIGMMEETLRANQLTPELQALYAELHVNFNGSAGGSKEDLILGNEQGLTLAGNNGNDILLGGSGNEVLAGGMGDDILSGGAGDDTLRGEYGNDTYVFRRGSGHDVIVDTQGSNSVFFAGLTPDDITVSLAYSETNQFTFTIKDTNETLSVGGRDGWWSYDTGNAMAQFIFSDGTIWDADEALRQTVAKPTDGNDVMIGSRVNDTINGLAGNDTIIGNQGNDIIDGGSGDDIIYGGAYTYNDYYTGELRIFESSGANGNDTYLFGRGDGHDIISDTDTTVNSDTLRFKDGIAPEEVSFARSNSNTNDLILTIKDTGDSVTIRDYFKEAGYRNPDLHTNEIERIEFSNGTVWTAAEIGATLLLGTDAAETIIGYRGDDLITGNAGNDIIDARCGNDTILGGDGNDIIRAGFGDDIIDGGSGDDVIYGSDSRTTWLDSDYSSPITDNDTYLFGKGDGHDTITDCAWNVADNDTIRFKEGISPSDITFQAANMYSPDLLIRVGDGSDTITIRNWFWSSQYRIERFEFSDGTVLDSDWATANLTVLGTAGSDILRGSNQSETLRGFGGDDVLYAEGGNDILDGGAGNDLLQGGEGDDTYLFGRGDGHDTVYEGFNSGYYWVDSPNDAVEFKDGVLPDDVIVRRSGNDMLLSIKGTNDLLTVKEAFNEYSQTNRIEQIRFSNGATWDYDEMLARALQSTDGDDILEGTSASDLLDGGAGNDLLKGGLGSDTYLFGRGAGNDTITEVYDWNTTDTVSFTTGITPADLQFSIEQSDLLITIKDTAETLRITSGTWSSYTVERFSFSDGTTLSWSDVQRLANVAPTAESLVGTAADDLLTGSDLNSTILGLEGNDTLIGAGGNDMLEGGDGDDLLQGNDGQDDLYGGNGNDTLIGGAGRDYLDGGNGANRYIFEKGTGLDDVLVRLADGQDDTIVFGEGITAADLEVQLGNQRFWDIQPGDSGYATLVVGTGEDAFQIEIDGWNDISRSSARRFLFSDGSELTLDQIIAMNDGGIVGYQYGTGQLTGSNADDELYGDGSDNDIRARAGDDFVGAGAGNDLVDGGSGNDRLYGDSGNDILIGGKGNDTLNGNSGLDTYLFNRGDGNDYIENSWAAGTKTLSFGADIAPADISAFVNENGQLVLQVNNGSDGSLTMDWFDRSTMTVYDQLPLQQVQFINDDGKVTIFDLEGLVQARLGALTNSDTGHATTLFENADDYDITYSTMPVGGDAAVAYAQTGDLFAAATYTSSPVPSDADDRIVGTEWNDTINAGNGNDLLYGLDGDDYLEGGAGNDRIDAGAGNDTIYGNDGNDLIMAGDGDDNIFAGPGTDIAYGGFGNDTYYFNAGDGSLTIEDDYLDTIEDTGGYGDDIPMFASFSMAYGGDYGGDYGGTTIATNVLQFGPGITLADLTFSADNGYLVIYIPATGDQLRLAGYDPSLPTLTRAVAIYRFSDGSEADPAEITAMGMTINGTASDDYLEGSDTGNDTLIGGFGDDTLYGGSGGNDRLEGGMGSDTYLFNRGSGVDTIVDLSVPDMENRVAFGDGIAPSQLLATIEDGVFVLQLGEGDALRFEGYDPRIPGMPSPVGTFEFKDGTVLRFDDLLAQGYELVGTPDQDTLRGTDGNDRIRGLAGNDTLIGGAGDDTYLFSAGDGVDTIDDLSAPGAENTVVLPEWADPDNIHLSLDAAKGELILAEDSTGNELHLTNFDRLDPYGKRAVEYFQFGPGGMILSYDELLTWVGGFTIDGTDGNDTLLGTAMSDVIMGGDGDDVLEGGAGGIAGDRLWGGSGDDTYLFNKGDGTVYIADFLEPGAGNVLQFGTGITPQDLLRNLRFERTEQGENDQGSFIITFGDGDTVIMNGFDPNDVDNSPRSVDTFRFDDGTTLSFSEVARFIFVVEGDDSANLLTGTNLSDRLYGYADDDQLKAGAGDDVLTGGTGNDRLEGGTGNDTYVFNLGDGNDTIIDASETGGENRVSFGSGITQEDVSYEIDGSTLLISYGDQGDSITIENFSRDGSSGTPVIDTLEFSDGQILTLNQFLNHAPQVEATLDDLQIQEDVPFMLQLDDTLFSDADGDTLTWLATLENGDPLPSWLSFDPATHSFSGTPDNGAVGDMRIMVMAADPLGTFASSAFTLTVTNVNDAPTVLNGIEDKRAVEDELFSFQLPAGTFKDVDAGDQLTLSAALSDGSVLPAWLTFDASTGTFSGTPDNSGVGALQVAVTATDLAGAHITTTFDLEVVNTNDAPTVLHVLANQAAVEDQPFSFTVPSDAFTDIDAGDRLNYTVTLADGSPLPEWLSFDAATATLTGTPGNDQVGTLALLVTAVDLAGATVSTGFSLDIANVNDAPVLVTPLETLGAIEDQPFSYTIPVTNFADIDTGDTLTLTVTLANGQALPAWLSFDPATATLTGTPANNQTGSLELWVHATDQSGATVSAPLTLNIANTNDAPELLTPLADQSAKQGQLFNYTIPADTFTDIDPGDQLTFSATLDDGSSLPAWLTFDASNGTFSGTPGSSDTGDISVMITATDMAGATVADSFMLSVAGGNSAPVATPDTALVTEDVCPPYVTGNVLTNDHDPDSGDSLTLTDPGFRQGDYGYLGISRDGRYGYILNNLSCDVQSLGRATQVTDHFDYTISDGKLTATSSLDITVKGTNDAPVIAHHLADQSIKNNKAFSFSLPDNSFIDIDTGDTLTYTATLANGKELPSWLKFDVATATFSGTAPKNAGYLDIKVTATDKVAATGSIEGSLSVSETFELSFGKSGKTHNDCYDDHNTPKHPPTFDWIKKPGNSTDHGHEDFRSNGGDEHHGEHHADQPAGTPIHYLDGEQLDAYLHAFDQPDQGTDHNVSACWQAISRALEQDLDAGFDHAFGNYRKQSGDFNFMGNDHGFGRGIADNSLLTIGSGTQLKEFKGLGEGLKRLG